MRRCCTRAASRSSFDAYDPDAPPVGLDKRFVKHMPAARAAMQAGDFRDWPAIDAWATQIAAEQRPASRAGNDWTSRCPAGRGSSRGSWCFRTTWCGRPCCWHSRVERGDGHCHPGDRPLPRAPRSPCCAGNLNWPGGQAAAPGKSPPRCVAPRKKRKGSPGSPTAGARACVDPDRIRQAIDNLLGNALRFAPAGSVIVIAAREDGPTSPSRSVTPALASPRISCRTRSSASGASTPAAPATAGSRPRAGRRRGDRRRPRRNSGRTQQTGRRCRGQPTAGRRLPAWSPAPWS